MSFRFIAGADDFLVHRKARGEWEVMAQSVGDAHAVEIIDGQAGNIEEVSKAVHQFISAIQTVSLFAPEKAIWFRNVTFLADSVTGRSQGTVDAVEHMQEILGNFDTGSVRILISASPVDRRKKVYKWFQEHGDSVFIEPGRDADAVIEMAMDEARLAGVEFTQNSAQILAELTGGDARLTLEETRKLVTYIGPGGGKITPAMVGELVPSLGDSDFFEAAEAFYSLDLEWALAAIHRHFFAGHDARPLISSLQNRNRLLIQLKVLQQTGAIRGRVSKSTMEQLADRFGGYFGADPGKSSFCVLTQNPWYLGRLAESLPRISLKALLEFQEAFCDAFMEIISRPNEQEAVMNAVAVRCISPITARSS